MITVTNLKKQFDSRGIAGLHGVSFTLSKGEVLAVLGPNGSGKTTLINLISGSIDPDDGEVKKSGEISVFPPRMDEPDQNVQKFLVNSVHLNIDDEKKIQLTRDLADTFEFTFQLRQKLSELSSGQRQKVMLAKELINRPALLLMDEPFAHLDPFSRKEILNALFKYIKQQELSVLWVTHDLDEAFKFSDRIGLLNFGKLEQLASPLEVIQKPKNLFVAKFVGYRNFFSVTQENSVWVSPWGKLPYQFSTKAEALLVVPDVAWSMVTEGTPYTVTDFHVNVQAVDYILQKDEQCIFWKRGPLHPLLEKGTRVFLTPDFNESFLIPL